MFGKLLTNFDCIFDTCVDLLNYVLNYRKIYDIQYNTYTRKRPNKGLDEQDSFALNYQYIYSYIDKNSKFDDMKPSK